MKNKPVIIGVGGLARSGKDTFVKIAKKIIESNGKTVAHLAFADALKCELDDFLKLHYGISAWTQNDEEKKIIRPLLVAHGCQKRNQTDGTYWVDKLDYLISHTDVSTYHVVMISDCRFPNEVKWVHDKGNGWFVHLKKYQHSAICDGIEPNIRELKSVRVYDVAPNEEESKNDPIIQIKSDYNLELESVIDREKRLHGIKITSESILDNSYLNKEIKLCLMKCPFLTIQ